MATHQQLHDSPRNQPKYWTENLNYRFQTLGPFTNPEMRTKTRELECRVTAPSYVDHFCDHTMTKIILLILQPYLVK
jgi:hypothetical protein